MHSPKQNTSTDEQQEISSDVDNVKIGPRTNSPSSITGNRSDVDSPVRSYALIETDSNELDRIIDILRQFFPNTKIVECNNSSSNPSRTPSRSSLATAPQQQTSIESNSSLRVPASTANRYRSHSHSISDKSSFESDILQNPTSNISETANVNSNDSLSYNTNSQAFKGKVKDYLQRRYLEQINEHQLRKETFLKCRSDDLNYRRLKRDSASGLVQSFEHLSQPEHHFHHHHHHHPSSITSSSSATATNLKPDGTLKARSFDSSAFHLQHSVSDTNLCCALSASDTNFIQTQSGTIIRSQSKRGLLQRCATIDMEDAPSNNHNDTNANNETTDELMVSSPTSPVADEKTDAGKITFSIDRPDDEEIEEEDDDDDETKSLSRQSTDQYERKSRSFRHSYSEQQTRDHPNQNFLLPFRHSFEQQNDKRTLLSTIPTIPFSSGVPAPLAPFSAASDPGPYHSPWALTPTNPYGLVNFHFPKSQEHLVTSAQGSIAQLSTLTKILCDEPSVFTPITPRFKTEVQEPNSTRTSSSVPACQICRQKFESRQMYLAHYRTHLENASEDDKSGILDYTNIDNNCDRPGESRNYSCKICSKRFSRSDMLNRHLRLHSGIRPYRCTMCNTHFSRSDHLSTHLRTHTGEKPYTCPECSYAACRRDMITRHLKVHSKQRSERKNATSSLGSSNES